MTTFSYEPNIISNPRTHFGVWTPEGWKVHTKRWVPMETFEVLLSGDGKTTRFTGLPTDFLEDGHSENDPHTDGGIYPSEPRVEYPLGRPRWAISHTYLAYPFADQTLYVQEVVWNRSEGTLETYFREHVALEEAWTDSGDGMTVAVQNRPLSQVIVGNKAYPHENSAVRGVWSAPDKSGKNFYTRDRWMRLRSVNAIYATVPHTPVVNCFGLWKSPLSDAAFFDKQGELIDVEGLRATGIPIEVPKLAALGYTLTPAYSRYYVGEMQVMADDQARIERPLLEQARATMEAPFQEHTVGFASGGVWEHEEMVASNPGQYCTSFDFNSNGVVDAEDVATLENALGKTFRLSYYTGAYYGWDWLSGGVLLNPELQSEPVIGGWSQGAGYDAESGIIRLHETPGPNQKVYVEYHYDRPAAPGTDNIRVLLHRECKTTLPGI